MRKPAFAIVCFIASVLLAIAAQEIGRHLSRGWGIPMAVTVALATMAIAHKVLRVGLLACQQPRPHLVSPPKGALVLYLRSFKADAFLSNLDPRQAFLQFTPSAAMEHFLRKVGDFRALGMPDEPDPIGQHRYATLASWSEEILDTLSHSDFVILHSGQTPGLLQEAEWVFGGRVDLTRVILLTPWSLHAKTEWNEFIAHVRAKTGIDLPAFHYRRWGFHFPNGRGAEPLTNFVPFPPMSPFFWARLFSPVLGRLGLRSPAWRELVTYRTWAMAGCFLLTGLVLALLVKR